MKRALLCLILCVGLGGCTPVQFANSFVSDSLQVRRSIPYGELERQTLDVYPVEAAKGVVVFVHGGYWDGGDKSDYVFLADTLTERDFVTVIVNYRLVPEVTFPSYVQDVALALDWVFENLSADGETANVFLMGHSAGAHIAALLAFDETYLNEAGLSPNDLLGFVGLAGPYDFLPLSPDDVRSRAALGPEANWTQTQPINFVDSTEPPTFLAVGLDDTTVNPANSERLAERLEQRGGQVTLKRYPGVDHTGLVGALARVGRVIEPAVLRDVAEFLNSQLRSE